MEFIPPRTVIQRAVLIENAIKVKCSTTLSSSPLMLKAFCFADGLLDCIGIGKIRDCFDSVYLGLD